MTQLHPQAKTTSLPATFFVPEFLRLEKYELGSLLHVLRDPLATHVFLLLRAHSDFKTGEFLGGYHRLMELCTPPQPERGRRRPGPSYQQLRRVIDDLIALALAKRDSLKNALQGQLRLQLTPREKTPVATELNNRINNRVAKGRTPRKSTTCDESGPDKQQDNGQGCQGVNTPLIPQTSAVIHNPATPHQDHTRPPEGAGQAPQTANGQVAASRLMAGQDSAESVALRKAEIAKARALLKDVKPVQKARRAPLPATAPTSFKGIAELL